MPQMMREVFLIAVTSSLAYLIMVKVDQQIVILLKGRLHRANFETRPAEGVWKRHASMMPHAIFPTAGALAGLTIILLTWGSLAAMPLALAALLCFAIGVGSRVRSFYAADQEIKTMLPPQE